MFTTFRTLARGDSVACRPCVHDGRYTAMIRGAALGALIVIVLLAVLGCSSANVTEQRHEQVPGKAWFVDIDTRPPSLVAPVDADGVRCTFQKAGVWFRDEAQYRRFIAEVQREYVQAKADAHFAKALNLLQVLRYFDEPAIPLISAGSACHPSTRGARRRVDLPVRRRRVSDRLSEYPGRIRGESGRATAPSDRILSAG